MKMVNAAIFEPELVPIPEASSAIRPISVFKELRRWHPDVDPGVRRTLKRQIRAWRAAHRPERAAVFRQRLEPGQRGLWDFTHMGALGVKIAGRSLNRMLYHFLRPGQSVYDRQLQAK